MLHQTENTCQLQFATKKCHGERQGLCLGRNGLLSFLNTVKGQKEHIVDTKWCNEDDGRVKGAANSSAALILGTSVSLLGFGNPALHNGSIEQHVFSI